MRWTKNIVEQAKLSVKEELAVEADAALRLKKIILRFHELQQSPVLEDSVFCLVYGMSALVHHLRHGGLRGVQIDEIKAVLLGVLRVQQISPGKSKLAFLHEELHSVLSQIYKSDARTLAAAWEHQAAEWASSRQDYFRTTLGAAQRSLRLGHGERATTHYLRAQELAANPGEFGLATIGLAKLLRLRGALERATEALDSIDRERCGEAIALESQWEQAIHDYLGTGDIRPLTLLVKRGRPHYSRVYCTEARLWSLTDSSLKSIKRTSKMSSFKQDRALGIPTLGFLAKAAQTIEECYDTDFPVESRLDKLGAVFTKKRSILAIDHELLVLAAAARWLHRRQFMGYLGLVIDEYQAISLRLSGGLSSDALGCCHDIIDAARAVDGNANQFFKKTS